MDDCVTVVGGVTDRVVQEFLDVADRQSLRVQELGTRRLAQCSLCLNDRTFSVAGWKVVGIFFRVMPHESFSDGFVEQDRLFSDAEIGATWLAAMNLPDVLAINRYDARAWFQPGWATWRSRLAQSGVAVSQLTFGDEEDRNYWLPYCENGLQPLPSKRARQMLGCAAPKNELDQTTLAVNGTVLAGRQTETITAAARCLSRWGISIATITTDRDDAVLSVDINPVISDPTLARRTAQITAGRFHDHLHRR